MTPHANIARIIIVLPLALSGCAMQTPIAFKDDAQRVTAMSRPFYLMTVTVRNVFHTLSRRQNEGPVI